ncbi:MAG: hypothetical protein E6R08_00515 [Nevskiaceae bacterium]|nr:MAG: hypothetical protein E6R08_00515 [Nevskiaceae bacterium]
MSNEKTVNPAYIRLTPTEAEWLVKMSTSFERRLSLLADAPPKRTMNGLVKKGLAKDIMGAFWEITELGQQRCTSIY